MKKKVLLTGGSGFIGRNLAEAFRDVYDLSVPTRRELDLLDAASVRAYFQIHSPDVVIHGATTPGHRNAAAGVPILETNLQMFFNLMAHRQRFDRLISLGSGSEYDMRHYEPKMAESYFGRHIPVDPSGFSKFVVSRFLEKDPAAVTLRLFGVFGRYEDYAIRFISNAICKTLFGRPITLKQDREFDYLYVADLAPVITHFIENNSRLGDYNVTTDEAVKLSTAADWVRQAAGKPTHPIEVSAAGLGSAYSGANDALRREIPDISFTPIKSAIAELYRWYSDRRAEIHEESLLKDR